MSRVRTGKMIDSRQHFLANLIADLGKLLIAAGVIKQVFSSIPNWVEIAMASIVALILFVSAFFTYPDQEG